MAKYDWTKLKTEFILGDFKTLKEFAESKDIAHNGYFGKRTKGWLEEKRKSKEKKEKKIIEKISGQLIKDEVSRNTKHLQAYDLALKACVSILADELKKGVDMFGNSYDSPVIIHSKLARVVDALEKIQKGQRLAEGLDAATDSDSLDKLDNILKGVSRVMKDD